MESLLESEERDTCLRRQAEGLRGCVGGILIQMEGGKSVLRC